MDSNLLKRLLRKGEADGQFMLRTVNTPQASSDVIVNGVMTTAQTYAIGDSIGGEKNITGTWLEKTASPLIHSITAYDDSGIGPSISVILSSSNMGGPTDGAALAPGLSLLGSCDYVIVNIDTADWISIGTGKAVTKAVGNMRIPGAYGGFYVNVMARSSYVMASSGDFRLAVTTDYS